MTVAVTTCDECGDAGFVIVPGHACGGNDRLCPEICPEPQWEQCPARCPNSGIITPASTDPDDEPF